MARSKKKVSFWKALGVTLWLLWCMAGGVLFSFGLNDAIQGSERAWISVVIGGVMVFIAILSGKFVTETALALGKR